MRLRMCRFRRSWGVSFSCFLMTICRWERSPITTALSASRCAMKGWFFHVQVLCYLLLNTTTQVASQEHLCHRVEPQAILRLSKAMSLVREEHILVFNASALHSLDDLFGLGLLNSRVVGPLSNQD